VRTYLSKPGPIIPTNAGALRSLTVTMTVMSYLACLAIGALILTDRAVKSWTSGLSREMTIQIRELQASDINAEVEKVSAILSQTPGIESFEVLDRAVGAKLLEPWLGKHNVDELPIPRLVRVIIRDRAPPDIEQLRSALQAVKGATLDTHQRWQTELTRMARALSVLSYAVLGLICISAVAMVVFATRAVLQANRPVVELLHLVGATDGYVARQIDGRFLKTGLVSGFLGMMLGLATFFLLSLTGANGSGGIADASRSLVFAPPGSAMLSYGSLFAVPPGATLIGLLTARMTLIRMLRNVL